MHSNVQSSCQSKKYQKLIYTIDAQGAIFIIFDTFGHFDTFLNFEIQKILWVFKVLRDLKIFRDLKNILLVYFEQCTLLYLSSTLLLIFSSTTSPDYFYRLLTHPLSA